MGPNSSESVVNSAPGLIDNENNNSVSIDPAPPAPIQEEVDDNKSAEDAAGKGGEIEEPTLTKEEEDGLAAEAETTGKTVDELRKEKLDAKKTALTPPQEEKGDDLLKPTDPPGFQKRINQMRKKLGDYERMVASRDAEIETLKAAVNREDSIGKPPDAGDFETEAEFNAALVSYNVKKELAADAVKKAKESINQANERIEKERKEKDARLFETLSGASEKYKDFDDVFLKNKPLKVTPSMVEILEEMPNMIDVCYYLGKNPSVSADISEMSMVQATLKLDSISKELANKIKKVPGAPPPVKPVRAQGGGVKDLSEVSMDEYRRRREGKK